MSSSSRTIQNNSIDEMSLLLDDNNIMKLLEGFPGELQIQEKDKINLNEYKINLDDLLNFKFFMDSDGFSDLVEEHIKTIKNESIANLYANLNREQKSIKLMTKLILLRVSCSKGITFKDTLENFFSYQGVKDKDTIDSVLIKVEDLYSYRQETIKKYQPKTQDDYLEYRRGGVIISDEKLNDSSKLDFDRCQGGMLETKHSLATYEVYAKILNSLDEAEKYKDDFVTQEKKINDLDSEIKALTNKLKNCSDKLEQDSFEEAKEKRRILHYEKTLAHNKLSEKYKDFLKEILELYLSYYKSIMKTKLFDIYVFYAATLFDYKSPGNEMTNLKVTTSESQVSTADSIRQSSAIIYSSLGSSPSISAKSNEQSTSEESKEGYRNTVNINAISKESEPGSCAEGQSNEGVMKPPGGTPV